jgi:integrase
VREFLDETARYLWANLVPIPDAGLLVRSHWKRGDTLFSVSGLPLCEDAVPVEVTPYACGRYADWRARSQNTIRRELAVLQAAINYAHRNGRITRAVAVTLPAKPPSKERWLTKREASLLLRASRTEKARLYLPIFILLGLYTGRRKEALRWPQVNLGAGLIDFEVAGRQRTNKKRGKVPIPRKLLSHLKRARRRGSDLGYVLHINGEPIGDINKGFAAACRRAGIEGVTPHTLRHTAATWLMQKGVDLWQASGFLAMSEKNARRSVRSSPPGVHAGSGRGHREKHSAEFPRNTVMFPMRSWVLSHQTTRKSAP